MAIEYTWSIPMTEYTNDDDKGVTICHWRCTGVDGDHSASAYSTQSFTPDPEADGYIAFADLTEATVIGWVQEALGGDEKVGEIKAAIQAKIDEQKNPTVVSGLPWAE